ncbi:MULTISPECIES: competence protein ComJ [Flavobacteriales]|uniref:Competence protein J (ComJ) n=1 Tax=Weeksella virosa (strain ATCC 43766 / DSM 16922 / JCM 21250 / CCUG 30538 / CDC 9751 / IAM 14551 / NBRC 16016 / NCTC 11634 / CL345/78) TaxID=865938 RepID=F0P2G4_WEEVC|nr:MULTISPECIES: competence protein ComJ [Weeksella]ADX66776.1 hypothetical protein Weevi_0048 [Weeksella virosa DSM 16922]MDK7374776.1 competence protein ComJ [Weeksella virosa]MDK7675134.1 competence protein ComJ [Weeksella virosa]OFM85195.1 hypothetical protein HMPREF2660_07805 [Weeksella sp. HMSC059D05]SUP53073.1 Competence protein J (ComJ) [Weeksella virosa]
MNSQQIDLEISHHQIHLRSGDFNPKNEQWSKEDIIQGAILTASHVTFDPIVDGDFAAMVTVSFQHEFTASKDALRIIKFPFTVVGDLVLSSVPAEHTLLVSPEEGTYTGYFEICESEEVSEVYYQFTFVSFGGEKEARFVMDDNFGGKKDELLIVQ